MASAAVNYIHIFMIVPLILVLALGILKVHPKLTKLVQNKITGYVLLALVGITILTHAILIAKKSVSGFMMRSNLHLLPSEFVGEVASIQSNEVVSQTEENFIAQNLPLWVNK